MPTTAELAYLELEKDARLELRLPRLLKEHAELVAAQHGESLTEIVLEALAARVAAELPTVREWKLTAEEQVELLRVLSAPAEKTREMRLAEALASDMFGRDALK